MKESNHIDVFGRQLQDVYTVFISPDINRSLEFYTKWFGFTSIFESSWFILLQSPGQKSFRFYE